MKRWDLELTFNSSIIKGNVRLCPHAMKCAFRDFFQYFVPSSECTGLWKRALTNTVRNIDSITIYSLHCTVIYISTVRYLVFRLYDYVQSALTRVVAGGDGGQTSKVILTM
jgi:hypothetical protein